jgi:hypothetical protein
MDRLFEDILAGSDEWATVVSFVLAMLTSWGLGLGCRRWARGGDRGARFTDASMALFGLLLAFTFAMSLGRHDARVAAVVAEGGAIGSLYTCASLLPEPGRSELQAAVRDYARHKLAMAGGHLPSSEFEAGLVRSHEMQARLTELSAAAIAAGTPIAISLTNALNDVANADTAVLAAYRERLPRSIVALLLVGSMVMGYLMGVQQRAADSVQLVGALSFISLVTVVLLVTIDLNQPDRGLVMVSVEPLSRLLRSMS